MAQSISSKEILKKIEEWESLKPTMFHKYSRRVAAVVSYQPDLFKDITIKLSVAAQEQGLDTVGLDAVATRPARATSANWEAAELTIHKLKFKARGAKSKSQNRMNRQTRSPTKPEAPLLTPVWSFEYDKDSDSAAEKERKAEPKPTGNHNEGPQRFPADHYASKYGIPADRLESARRDGRLKNSEIRGKRWYYDDAEVRRFWPQDFEET
jgi:hypothetical protein